MDFDKSLVRGDSYIFHTWTRPRGGLRDRILSHTAPPVLRHVWDHATSDDCSFDPQPYGQQHSHRHQRSPIATSRAFAAPPSTKLYCIRNMASSLHLQPPSRPPSSSPRSSLSSNSSHTHESTAPPPQQLLEQHEMAPIEARSLAPVIKLAANPPLDIPNVDAASQRSSLLLWIVRVPESNGLLKLLPIHVTHTQWAN